MQRTLLVALSALALILCARLLDARDGTAAPTAKTSSPPAAAPQSPAPHRQSLSRTPDSQHERSPTLRNLKLGFIENAGQWDDEIAFVRTEGTVGVVLNRSSVVLTAETPVRGLDSREPQAGRGVAVGMDFVGATLPCLPSGRSPRPTVVSDFSETDRARWRSGLRTYDSVVYKDLYSGIDLRFRESKGLIEYDVLLEPWADLKTVRIRCTGLSSALRLEADGSLVMPTCLGDLRQLPPMTFEASSGRPLPSRFRLLAPDVYTFDVDGWTAHDALVIDPGIVWAGTIGAGSGITSISNVGVHPSGDLLLVGTAPAFFPTTAGTYNTTAGGALLIRASPAGTSIVFATFLGPGRPSEVVADAQGDIFVAGVTNDPTFPTTPGAYSTTLLAGLCGGLASRPCYDIFISRLNSTGTTLIASTFVGGSLDDILTGMAIAPSGLLVLAGITESSNFPVTPGAASTLFNLGLVGPGSSQIEDAFALLIDPGLTSVFSATFHGGSGADGAYAMCLLDDGSIALAGNTTYQDLPTVSAYQPASGGSTDGWVAIFAPDLSALTMSTYLGGAQIDVCETIADGRRGDVVVSGLTYSQNFPVTAGAWNTVSASNPFQQPLSSDAFISRLDRTGGLISSTYLGGSNSESTINVATDLSGAVVASGVTGSANFPRTGGAYAIAGGEPNAFLVRFDPSLSLLLHAGTLPNQLNGGPSGMILLPGGDALVVGTTSSPAFPVTPGAPNSPFLPPPACVMGFLTACTNAYITRWDFLPTGTLRAGLPSPCPQSPLIGTVGFPQASATFGVTCSGAPANAPGLLAIGSPGSTLGLPAGGLLLYLDLAQPWAWFPVAADAAGYVQVLTPVPPGFVGITFAVQFAWAGDPCGAGAALSSSDGLFISIQ